MEMDKYIELCSIFGLKCLAENTVSIIRMHMRVKLNVFILVEFCTSTIIFSSEVEGARRKDVRTLDIANNYLLTTFL